MRSLGIDFGERRIGLAISDDEGRFAVPLECLERRSDRQAIGTLREIVRREQVERLVIGEPCDSDGDPTLLAGRIRRFGERLASATDLPVCWTNEHLTSVEAERQLRERGVDLRRNKDRVDMLAAKIILQDVLDHENRNR
jgi:putative Holliday junction resolvase